MVRLQKLIAASGILSRRKAEEAIASGRVRVNGQLVTELGTKVDPLTCRVEVDGKKIETAPSSQVVLFYKPSKVVTTKSDPEGRKTVMHFFPESMQSIKPVGRLDFGSEGLLILTNDGDLANRIAHPRYNVEKEYLAWVSGIPSPQVLTQLTRGMKLTDGPGRFDKAALEKEKPGNSPTDRRLIRVVVTEGRNRFVRRMLEAVGHPVLKLKRIRIGPLILGTLAPGRYRLLSPKEIQKLETWLNLRQENSKQS